MTSTEIKSKIDALSAEIAPTLVEIADLQKAHREALSREWVAANSVSKAEVEPSSGEDRPYFGHVASFVDWLKGQPHARRWAEWNGRLYSTAELIAGTMAKDAPGRYEHAV